MIEVKGATGGVINASDYSTSFGNFPTEQCYSAGMNRNYQVGAKTLQVDEEFGLGMRGIFYKARCEQNAQLKALITTTGTGGATTEALIPIFIDPRIVDISRKQTPLVELFPRVSNQGIVAAYVRVTGKDSATTALEDGALTEQNFTRVQEPKSIKYLFAVGRVSGPALQAIPAFTLGGFQPSGSGLGGSAFGDAAAPNAMQQEVLLAARSLKEFEEQLIVNGNSTTSVGPGPNGSEFDGFVTLQGTTNQNDLDGAELTWDDVENTVALAFAAGGQPNLGIASISAMVKLRAIMIDTLRISPSDNVTELSFGITAKIVLPTMVGDIPMIPSRFLNDTAAQRSIYFLDMDWIEMRVLLDMVMEELAKTNDSRKFMLKIYETMILRAPEFNSFIDNIA